MTKFWLSLSDGVMEGVGQFNDHNVTYVLRSFYRNREYRRNGRGYNSSMVFYQGMFKY